MLLGFDVICESKVKEDCKVREFTAQTIRKQANGRSTKAGKIGPKPDKKKLDTFISDPSNQPEEVMQT